MLLDLINTLFCRTPAAEGDSSASGAPASAPAGEGNRGQGGALNSDVVEISKKEYQDILSQLGYHKAFQSNVDKRIAEYEKQIEELRTALSQQNGNKPPQKSALEQILERQGNNGDDDLLEDTQGVNFMKQAFQALQSDLNSKLVGFQDEIKRLNSELENTRNENINASRTTTRKLNIDNAMNEKISRLMSEYNISRNDAIDYLLAEEDVLSKYTAAQSGDDNSIGSNYVDDTLGAVRDLAKRMNELETHKNETETKRKEREAKIDALLEGDKSPSTIVVDLHQEDKRKDMGLTPQRDGEDFQAYISRQLREQTAKKQAERGRVSTATGFK